MQTSIRTHLALLALVSATACGNEPTLEPGTGADPFDGAGELASGLEFACAGAPVCAGSGATWSSVYRVGATPTSRGELVQTFPGAAGVVKDVTLHLRSLRPFSSASPVLLHAKVFEPADPFNPVDDDLASVSAIAEGSLDLTQPGAFGVKTIGLSQGTLEAGHTYALAIWTDDLDEGVTDTLLVGVGALQGSALEFDAPEVVALRRGLRGNGGPLVGGRFRAAGNWDLAFALTFADVTPDAFDFVDRSAQATSAIVTSAPVTIEGFEGSLTASVAGGGTPQISVNGGAWVSSAPITAGQTLAVRLTSSGAFGATTTATVDVGGVTADWSVTTVTQQPGSVDTSFAVGAGATGKIHASDDPDVHGFAVQADGKVVVGGNFTHFQGTARRALARVNANGSLDTGFAPATGTITASARVVKLRGDGLIFIGGAFTAPKPRIMAFEPNGATNAFTSPGSGLNEEIREILIQPDDKLLVGGDFWQFNGGSAGRLIRFNADASRDTGFSTSADAGLNGSALALDQYADGRLLVAGSFTTYNGGTVTKIMRLQASGALDTSFAPQTIGSSYIQAMKLQADGKIVIGGYFTTIGALTRNRVARLNDDGSVDTTFDPGVGPNDGVLAMDVQPDGKVVIGGLFTSVGGTARKCLARLNADGTLDSAFNPGTGAGGSQGQAHAVMQVEVRPDGKIFVSGRFQSFNGHSGQIVRLHGGG